MTATFTLPGEFGYVILIAIASLFMVMWKAAKVGGARKKYEVPDASTISAKMAETFTLPGEFGYVILTVIASLFMIIWKAENVVGARKKYEVPYPKMYSDNDNFNCYQRAHQNTLEGYPIFLVLLIFGGLTFPKMSAIAGIVWIAGRVFYALGYYTGDPSKRMRGAFGYIGLLSLLVFSIITALKLLGWIG